MLNIESVYVEWWPSSNAPTFHALLKTNLPDLKHFKFEKHVIDDRSIAYRGVCGVFVMYFHLDVAVPNEEEYDKPLTLKMKDGTVSIVSKPWRWYASDFNQYFPLSIDAYLTTPELGTGYYSLTLEGAKLLAKAADVDLAIVTRSPRGFSGYKITGIEPIRKSEPTFGSYEGISFEKIPF